MKGRSCREGAGEGGLVGWTRNLVIRGWIPDRSHLVVFLDNNSISLCLSIARCKWMSAVYKWVPAKFYDHRIIYFLFPQI